MAKPGTIPQWDSNGTNIVTPPSGKLTDGWINGEKGNSSYMNWFMYWVYLWIVWLNGLWGGDGSLTLDNNANVTVSGTGKYKRGDLKRTVPFANVRFISGTTPTYTIDSFSTGGTSLFAIDLMLNEGERIKGLNFYVGDGGGSTTFKLYKRQNGIARVQVGTTSTATAGGDQTVTMTLATPETFSAGFEYYVEMSFGGYSYTSTELITDVA